MRMAVRFSGVRPMEASTSLLVSQATVVVLAGADQAAQLSGASSTGEAAAGAGGEAGGGAGGATEGATGSGQ